MSSLKISIITPLVLFVLLVNSIIGFAAEGETLAVFEMRVESGIPLPRELNTNILILVLGNELYRVGRFRNLIDRDTMEINIQQAMGGQKEPCDFSCETEIAGALGVHKFVISYLNIDYDGCLLILKLHRGRDAVLLSSVEERVSCNQSDLENALREGAKKLLADIRPALSTETKINIISTEEALVEIDGISMGKINADKSEIFAIQPGEHFLALRKEGFLDWVVNFTIERGEQKVFRPVWKRYREVIDEEKDAQKYSSRQSWLFINSKPRGATVFINEEPVGRTPFTSQPLLPGQSYYVRVIVPLYHPFEQTIPVGPGVNRLPPIILKPNFGYLSLDSRPPGALVYLNDKQIGTTPLPRMMIKSGQYEIRLMMPDYNDLVANIEIRDNQSLAKTYSLRANFSQLSVETIPEGAEITLDGIPYGKTPVLFPRVKPGSHLIRAEHPLYEPNQTMVTMPDNNEIVRVNLMLVGRFGYLSVESEPTGAQVQLDNHIIGRTPLSNWFVVEGEHQLAIIPDEIKYHRWEGRIAMKRNGRVRIKELLRPKLGILHIFSEPTGARIYLDGTENGLTPITLSKIPAGDYKIELKKAGFVPWVAIAAVREEKEEIISVKLSTIDLDALYYTLSRKQRELMNWKNYYYKAVGEQNHFWLGFVLPVLPVYSLAYAGHSVREKQANFSIGLEVILNLLAIPFWVGFGQDLRHGGAEGKHEERYVALMVGSWGTGVIVSLIGDALAPKLQAKNQRRPAELREEISRLEKEIDYYSGQ